MDPVSCRTSECIPLFSGGVGDKYGKIIIAKDLRQAAKISNEIAPEHLEICVDEPFKYLDKIRHAGSVFMGKY